MKHHSSENSHSCGVNRTRRSAAAAVEFYFCMLAMMPLLIGTWEVGRLIQVQQIVANAARSGARLAAQGYTVSLSGAPTQILLSVAPAANTTQQSNVKAAVFQTLYGEGLTNLAWGSDPSTSSDDVQVYFNFIDTGLAGNGLTAAGTQPYQGVKGQTFTVQVIVNFTKVRWTTLGIVNPTTVSYTVTWQMLVDDPFVANTTVPSM